MASAISLNPSTIILGTDGNWVTYSISIGTPSKAISVLPSTVLSDTWAINGAACNGYQGNNYTNCENQRGTTFDPSSSTSWQYLFGTSSLAFSLGVEGSYYWKTGDTGFFGHDTLGLPSSKGLVPIQNALIGSVNTNSTTTGLLGLAMNQIPLSDNGTTIENNSTLQLLYDAGTIPSRSWSYSAGAFYNNTGGLLILGGYDAASFVPNDVEFTFASDPQNILSVGLVSASANLGGTTTTLSDSSVQALIDSTVAELWLPASWCQAFAKTFNLTYSPNNQLYTITPEAIAINNKKNPTVAIEIANTFNANGPSVTINFPWAAFHANYTNLDDIAYSTPYFLLRNATQQPTLGRAFLQEAVLTVDHERRNFSVSQVKNLNTGSQQLVNIYTTSSSSNGGGSSPTPTTVSDSSGGGGGIGGGAIAGIIIAVLVIAAAIAGFFIWKRRHRNQYSSPENARAEGPLPLTPGAPNEKPGAAGLAPPMQQHNQHLVNDYHAQQVNHVKAAMSGPNELEGDAFNSRSLSPAPQYMPPNTIPRDLRAELPENRGRSELHTPAASPEVQSPGISELGSSPDEHTTDGMTWETNPDQNTQRGTGRIAYSPGGGPTQLRDVRSTRNGPSTSGIGSSSRGNEIPMSATSGPLSQDLGNLSRSATGSLKR